MNESEVGGSEAVKRLFVVTRRQPRIPSLPILSVGILQPSALVYFCSSSSPYFSQAALPPPSAFSDLARALSPEERGKSLWQTAAFVEEQEIAKRGKQDGGA